MFFAEQLFMVDGGMAVLKVRCVCTCTQNCYLEWLISGSSLIVRDGLF
jgi:hypothetical protein